MPRAWLGRSDAEHEADGDGDERGDVAGQRAVDAHIHERVAAGNAGADPNDSAGGSAERGRGKHPGQSGVDAVGAAGEVVAELMDEQNAEQREREGEAGEKRPG